MIRRAAAAMLALAALSSAVAQDPAPTPAPDVLVQDPAALSAWRGVRERLSVRVAELRNACELGPPAGRDDLDLAVESMRDDLDAFADLAARLAPEESPEVAELRTRIERLLENIVAHFDDADRVRTTATLRILEESAGRLEVLAEQSDRRVGRRPSIELARVPADWGEPLHPEPGARVGLALMDARTLRNEIAARRRDLADQSRRTLREDHLRVAREIGEMGRALVARQSELPPVSREGFVHAALRIDVVADNLAACHVAGDRLAFRRQLLALADALRDVDSYLAVQAGLAGSRP